MAMYLMIVTEDENTSPSELRLFTSLEEAKRGFYAMALTFDPGPEEKVVCKWDEGADYGPFKNCYITEFGNVVIYLAPIEQFDWRTGFDQTFDAAVLEWADRDPFGKE